MAEEELEENSEEKQTVIVPGTDAQIRNMIYTVHGQQVMLDSDLAELYGVLTGNLNKAASRNAKRFPEDFRFRLSKEEYESLMFQTGISNDGGRGGRRKPPYVYTKQGVSMLSAALKSEVAVRASVQIIRAFVEMRHLIAVPS